MNNRQHDKAAGTRSGWSRELQATSCRTGRGFPGTAGEAKHFSTRAQRRVDGFFVEEGLEDYQNDEQVELDSEHDLWDAEDFNDTEEPELDLDLLVEAFNGQNSFWGDCNYPGQVYYCREEHLEACKETLREEGGSPFGLSSEGALSLVLEGDDFDGRWYLMKAPDWWWMNQESAIDPD